MSTSARTEEQRLDWLRLIRSENVGPRTFHDLVRYFGGVRPALDALPGLARRGGSARPPRICTRGEAEAELKAADAAGIKFFTLGEPEYPARLAMIDDRGGSPFRIVDHGAPCRRARTRGFCGARFALDPRSEGTNGLLKQGAIPVTEAADVISAIEPILGRPTGLAAAQELPQEPLNAPDVSASDDERSRLIALLGPSPVSIDDLVRLARSSITTVRSVLLELEIAGRIERHGAGLVSLL